MKTLVVGSIIGLTLFLTACSGRQPPGGDLWKIPVYMEQQR